MTLSWDRLLGVAPAHSPAVDAGSACWKGFIPGGLARFVGTVPRHDRKERIELDQDAPQLFVGLAVAFYINPDTPYDRGP